MRVLALDPGLKTGVCLYNADAQEIELSLIIPDGLHGLLQWGEFHDLEYDVLVVESFELEEGTHGIDLTPVQIIGWLRSLDLDIQWQRRNQRGKNKTASVPVLKRAGLYPKRGELKEGHQVAALQHALAYLMKIRHHETISLLHPREEL